MELSPLFIGTILFILLLMALRRPSRSTERIILVPIDEPVREESGCMPLVVAIVLLVLLAALIQS